MKCHRQYILLLLQVILFVENCFTENLILNINFKKPIAVTNDAFLSFTLDPETLLHNIDDLTENIERSTNMARSLAPAYIRIAGPQSNAYNFKQTNLNDVTINSSNMLSELHWALIHQWAENAGLNVIACITPRFIENQSKTHSQDSTNVAEFISFSEQMSYNVSWQLGYECQTRCEFSGEKLGKYVANLRDLLEIYPGYSNNLIIGPDIVAYRTKEQQRYLQDYFNSADDALSAITWHPNFASVSLNNNNISLHYDNLAAEMDEIYKIIGHTAGNKPLWIAESKPDKYKHQHLGALIWTRRLGNAAKLGIQVVMRQPHDLDKATPDYWVSLLHKTLVGREVLEMKIQHSDNENVHFYSQCTKRSAFYNKGAITIFGVNLTPETVTANLKGLKIKTLHKYILSPDFTMSDKMFSEKVLLNNKPLNLIDDKKIPNLRPEIIIDPDNLEIELSSGNIGFWVIPDTKIKACMYLEGETNIVTKKLSKRHEDTIQQDNQDRKEKDASLSNFKNQKTYTKDRRKWKNMENKNQQDIWNSKLLGRIRRVLQKRLLRKEKNNSSNFQRSITVVLKKGDSSEKEEEQLNLNNNFKAADGKLEDVRDTLKKYKRSLLERKNQMESESKDLKTKNLDNVVTLISKIDTLLQLDEQGVTSNEATMNKIKDEIENEAKLIVGINEKLKKYLYTSENFSKNKNVIEKLKKYLDILFNILQDNELSKNDENNKIPIQKSSIKNRFRRDLNRISENSKETKILRNRSRIDLKNLKNHMAKQKIKRKNFRRKLISDNSSKNCDKNNCRSLLRRNSVKRFRENEAPAVQLDHNSVQQKFRRESNRRKKNNTNRKYSIIDNIENYQNSMQKLERAKREIDKKLTEIGLRKKNISKRRLRIDDVKDYLNEKKIKKKDDSKKEELLIPFNPRTTESGENNFYGFFRRDPINNFPEGDIFVITGDSLEQNDKDYDYVEDENDDVDSLKQKNTQHEQISMLDYTEDDVWKESQVENNHRDYMPNEFSENVKLSDTEIKEDLKNYGDLWEAQYFSEEHENKDANIRTKNEINDKKNIAEILEAQYKRSDKIEEKCAKGTSMQYDQNAKYEKLKHFSTTFDQLTEIPVYINHHMSNVRSKETKLKANPESKVSFYQPTEVFTVKYNYGNYQATTAKYDEAKLSKEKDSIVNVSNGKDDINTKIINFYKPAEYPISNGVLQNGRTKRSNWKKLKMDLAREMIKEDENNAKDCHCRVIRASDAPKKSCHYRVKRDNQVFDSSSEIGNVNTDNTYFDRNLMTKEDYDKIMTGEILPSTNINNSEYDESNTITKTVIAKSNEVDYGLNNAMQTTDAISTLLIDDSTNNISEQNDNTEESIIEPLFADSILGLSLNSDNTVEDITKETFFRTESSDVQTKNETTTYDLPQIDYRIYPDNRKDLVSPSITSVSQKTSREKKEVIVDKEEKIENSTQSTIITNQEDEERRKNNYASTLKPTISLEGITEDFAKKTIIETNLLKRAIDKSIDNSKSNETETRQKFQQNIEDNLKNKSESEKKKLKSKKDVDTKRIKNMLQNLPKAPLRGLAKIEENLIKRAEQIEKRKEKLYVKRDKLLRQYQQELSQIADEQKRNLKRREIWERFCESDDFHQLNDQEEFIGIFIDDNISYEDDEEYNDEEEYDRRYIIPIELTSKQYDALLDQIYPFAKKVYYSKHNRSQFLRQFLGDEQDSTESSSTSDKIFAIDPSTYHGGEPILQLHKDYTKPKYHSQIESQIQIPKWMLKDFYKSYSRKLNRDSISKLREDMRKSPIKDYHNLEKADVLYVLNTQKWSDLPKELTQVWLNSIDRRDINPAVRNKVQVKSSNYKNLEEKHDVLDSAYDVLDIHMTDKETEFVKNFDTKGNAGDKKFASFNDGKDTLNFTPTENTEDVEKITKNEKFENMSLAKDMKIKKDIKNEQLVDFNNTKKDLLNIRTTKDLRSVEKMKETENSDTNKKEEMLNIRSRKTVAKTRRLNRKNKNIVEDKDIEINKSYNSNEVKENLNIKVSNSNETIEDVERVTDVDPESNELEGGVARIRRSIKKSRSKKYLGQPPYFLLTRNNARNRQNRDIHIYLNKNPEKMFPEKGQHIFLRKMSDSIDDDNSSEDFQVPIESSRFLTKKIADLINEYTNNESSEKLENYETLLFLSNLLNKTVTDISDEKIYSESEQDISDVEDTMVNYESKKEDEQYGSKSKESDKYLEMKDKIQSYYNPIHFHKRGMLLLFPRRNEKRQRREIKNEINENINEIKREKQYKSILAQDPKNESAEYYLNNNDNKEEGQKVMKKENTRTNYLKSEINKRNHDNLLKDFIEAKRNNLHNNEISFFMKNKDKDKNVLKNEEKLSHLKEPISILKNLITRSEGTQDFTESIEQFVHKLGEKCEETFVLEKDKHSKHETSETNNNDLSIGFIQKLFVFFSEIPRIFMYKS